MSRILVVDDEPNLLWLLAEALLDEGHQVLTAGNGAEALAALDQEPPHAVILDLMMPVLDGWGFLEGCRQHPAGASLPVIVVSAVLPARDPVAEYGAAAFFAKPFDLAILLTCVSQLAPALE